MGYGFGFSSFIQIGHTMFANSKESFEIMIFFFRFDKGSYQGVDESNVKLEVTCIKFPPARKVSKMLNGLGDAM